MAENLLLHLCEHRQSQELVSHILECAKQGVYQKDTIDEVDLFLVKLIYYLLRYKQRFIFHTLKSVYSTTVSKSIATFKLTINCTLLT